MWVFCEQLAEPEKWLIHNKLSRFELKCRCSNSFRSAVQPAPYHRVSMSGRVLSVPDAYPTIGEAYAQAVDGDRIDIAAGTYTESLFIII